MIELAEIRSFMRQKAEDERTRSSVTVEGATIEDALAQATIELGLPLRKIEYELIEQGARGVFGMGKKPVKILAYEAKAAAPQQEGTGAEADSEFEDVETPVDMDGQVFVRLAPEGVMLKVFPPEGNGRRVTEKMALESLEKRGITDFDRNLVKKIVRLADGESVWVGNFEHNPLNDSMLSVDIRDNEMSAFVVIAPPGPGGSDLAAPAILGLLKANGVIHGINEDLLLDLENMPVYNTPVCVAKGTSPVPGKNARITYNFELDRHTKELKERNGRVDFKEMNFILNVVEGQVLAKKIPPDEGTPGRTVLGKLLPTRAGTDIKFEVGRNVRLAENGATAVAEINGQVIMDGDRINVEPIYVVEGDVNLKSGGNVVFLGTVIVKGSVADGFKVKAAGNIEVEGNVGKADLDSEGDIIVRQGINGKTEGAIRAAKGVWAKFIENSNIVAGEIVFASDGIINSNVDSNKMIISEGKRATIVGGRLRATEEVRAKTFGSPTGSETIIEVGYDPKSSSRMVELEEALQELRNDLEDIERNLATLESLKKAKGGLPEDKEGYYGELQEKKAELTGSKEELEREQEELREHMSSLLVAGKVSASSRIYPGVKVIIKDASLKVRTEFRAITLINDNHDITPVKYEEMKEDMASRKPKGMEAGE
ncbi:MAG: FapA family protein [Spirochaetales bacterium]|jgi:uncharacterized protein (DUF342 family)|nr:FapA family protein [Spirochaetales bacterium]